MSLLDWSKSSNSSSQSQPVVVPYGSDPIIEGLYSPSLRQVGCVLISAAFGIRDRRVNNVFNAKDWFVTPAADMIRISAPLSQWRFIAELPREDRPGPEAFAPQSPSPTDSAEGAAKGDSGPKNNTPQPVEGA